MIIYGRTNEVTHEWTRMGIRQDTPVILAAMQTFEGPDTANVRIRSHWTLTWTIPGIFPRFPPEFPGGGRIPDQTIEIEIFDPSVKIEEERSADFETEHTKEIVGHIAFEPGRIENNNGDEIGYAGIIEVDQPDEDTWRRLPVSPPFSVDNSVAVMQILSFNGEQPAHPRMATSHPETGDSGFHFKIEEWPTYDQYHVSEKLGYVVLKEGRHALGRGEDPHLEVGTTEPFNFIDEEDSWQTVDLENVSGSGPPTVVTQCQTFNGPDPVVTRQRMQGPANSPSGLEVRLQEAESQGAHPAEETVGYVAMGVPLF